MHQKYKQYGKAVVNLLYALIIILFLIYVFPKIVVFFSPFILGWFIAMIARPLVLFFENKIKLKRKASSAFVIISVIALVVFVLYMLGTLLVQQTIGFVVTLPTTWKNILSELEGLGNEYNIFYDRLPLEVQNTIIWIGNQISERFANLISNLSAPTIEALSNFAKQLPTIVVGAVMAILSSYFFVAEREHIISFVRFHMPNNISVPLTLVKKSIVESIGGYLKAQLKIEIWMYLLLVIGLSILQVNYVLLISLGIAFLDFFPIFGTGTVMIPWALYQILSGNYKMAVGLLIIWGVGQFVRQLIQPKIVGDSIGVAPIPTLFLLYIGYRFAGVFGMIFAVPFGLVLFTLYEEGAFDTVKKSIILLMQGFNEFRSFTKEDLSENKTGKEENSEKL